jgi:hypothetical protein
MKRSRAVPVRDALKIAQAAELANCSTGTIRNYLPFLKTWMVLRPGQERGIRYVSRASLEEFLKNNTREGM